MARPAVTRWNRYRQAVHFFRRLYPTLGAFRLSKLVALAVAYSARPDWYK